MTPDRNPTSKDTPWNDGQAGGFAGVPEKAEGLQKMTRL
jgi:hypothetical protein